MTAIAIDFGTSNTVVCAPDPVTQVPQTLTFDGLSRQFQTTKRSVSVIPSVAYIKSPDRLLFGQTVLAKRLGFLDPERYFQAFKRELAADFQSPPRLIDGIEFTAERVATEFVRSLWQHIPKELQADRVIFTAPVGAFERYLDWFYTVAEQLNIPTIQLVDESTAAALGYAVKRPGSLVLVIDFGGGTLDLSLVRTVPATRAQATIQAEVLAKADAYMGGVDIDSWIVEHYLQHIGSSRQEVGELGWKTLLELAETIKIRLSTTARAQESWFDDESFMAHEMVLTQAELAEILETHQLQDQIRQSLDEILAIALHKGISKAQIDLVLLVGGSCQIPSVQQLILSYFGRKKVRLHKPFEAVAHGALYLSQLDRVEDYLHHSYAIRLWDPFNKHYSYYKLFDRGSQYPCRRPSPLTLQVANDGQDEIRLDIGEIADVTQAEVIYDEQGRMTSTSLERQEAYRSLDANRDQVCVAHLDPPGQVGIDRISVQFEVNEHRVLVATVRDLLTDQILVNQEAIAKLH